MQTNLNYQSGELINNVSYGRIPELERQNYAIEQGKTICSFQISISAFDKCQSLYL